MRFLQKSFNEGLDLVSSDSQVSPDGYVWLVNGRSRFGRIEPTNQHEQLEGIPDGDIQGTIAVGNVHFLFIDGLAYYRIDDTVEWIKVPFFQMSGAADKVWSIAVEASTKHFVRKLNNDTESVNDPILETVEFKVQGTPAGIVVQDGLTQPWLIEWDEVNNIFVARLTKTYAQWVFNSTVPNTREYVPIGREMFTLNSKLYIVAPDRKAIYQSVSGRMLDFMVNVDINGNKLPTEEEGGAMSVSFAFDFDNITCVRPIDAPDTFIYGTNRNTRLITLDYTKTIFGEPTYRQAAIVKSGIVNQDSMLEMNNGDIAFISPDGVKSFNAVEQLRTRSNGTVFTLQVGRLLVDGTTTKPIKQVECSCIKFDNYGLFNLDTFWGNIIVAYDMLKDQWCSLDITIGGHRVKQFALMETELEDKLFCVNGFDEVFQLYSSTDKEVPELRVRSMVDVETMKEHKSVKLICYFQKGTFDGDAFVTEYVDDQLSSEPELVTDPLNAADYRNRQDLFGSLAGIPFPVIPPVIPNNKQRVDTVTFPLSRGLKGKKISFILQWTNDSQLIEFELVSGEDENIALKQKNATLS